MRCHVKEPTTMPTQTYANHRHNPQLTGIGYLFVLLSVVGLGLRAFGIGGHITLALGLGALIAAVLVLLTISRAYTTKLQDRIIKLEMRLRCAQLLTPAQQATVARLTNAQIVALRFASDAELAALVDRAEREHLKADEIKRAITTWVPDWDRT
jgi:hypothetical protein